MIEYLLFATLGIGAGIVTGLIPGLHVNNLTPILVGLTVGSTLNPPHACSLIVAMMLTHTFLDFIPATFLGVPNKDTALSVLPAHKLVLDGRGYEVIKLTALGSLGALLLSSLMAGVLTPSITAIYGFLNPHLHWILLGIIIFMFALEKNWKKRFISMGIFLLSGILGLIVLESNLVSGDGGLVPLLSGMFGISILLISIKLENGVPRQKIDESSIGLKNNAKPIFAGASAGFLTGVIPGVGPAQGTVLSQAAMDSEGKKDFLIGVSGVNTAKALLSFVALYAIGRPRSGAAVAVKKIMEIGTKELTCLIGVALFSGGIATILHLKIGKIAAKNIKRLPYKPICLVVMGLIVGLSFIYAGVWGIPILLTATAVGLLPPCTKVKRTHCMGVLMVPIILYFAGLENAVTSIMGI